MATFCHQIHHLLHVVLMQIQKIGRHMKVGSNLRQPSSSSPVIKCQQATSTHFSTSGPRHYSNTVMNRHSQTILSCMIPSIQHLWGMFLGNHSISNTTVC